MNARPVTDAQISRALRAHLPERAAPGLRERVLEATETTAQLRSFPSFLGALSEADPVSRRRSLLIAAALLVALAFASAAAVGAWRSLQRDPADDLSLEPPADLPAFVLSSYERLPELPPVALTWHDSDSAKGLIYVHRSGAVRFDRFASAEASEPSSYTILSGNRLSGMGRVESEPVWVEQDEAIGDDPRVFLRTILSRLGEGPGCEMERDPSEVGEGTAATGWRYVGVEYVAGRPTHHVACVGDLALDIDLWLDVETRLILRTREPLTDEAGRPIQGQFGTTEVTEIVFGEQPAALFEPPDGVTRMPMEAYIAYLCTRDLPDEEVVGLGARSDCPTPTEGEATSPPAPTPMPTLRPSLGPRPSRPAGPQAWTPASLTEDWPAAVRPEPAGGSSVMPMPLTHIDPTGDTESDAFPWADIKAVRLCGGACLSIGLESDSLSRGGPPDVDPTEQWIAYGIVADIDRDGVPDWRYGIDNAPVPAAGGRDAWVYRVWRTDLHTGRTEWAASDRVWLPSKTMFYGDRGRLHFGGYAAGVGPVGGLPESFYAWASVIEDGRVVATDYAPDTGWLVATPGAKPGGTYLVEDPFPLRVSMTVAEGWTVDPGVGPNASSLTRDSGDTRLLIVIVDNLAEDDCDTPARMLDPPLGPSVDDLVTFLEDLPLIDFSTNADVTLDGYRGKYLEYRKIGRDESCGWGGPGGWPTNSGFGDVDESSQVWVLDVDGVRLVIHGFSQGASETVKAEFRRMVESIQIGP